MERVYLLDRRRAEAPVSSRVGACVLGLKDTDVTMLRILRTIALAKANGAFVFVSDHGPEGGHDGLVER